jgi:hypothetical protein
MTQKEKGVTKKRRYFKSNKSSFNNLAHAISG